MKSFSTLAMFAGLLMFTAAGCGDQTASTAAPEGGEAAAAGDADNDHDDADHDHADGEDHDHDDADHDDADHDHADGEEAAEGEETPTEN